MSTAPKQWPKNAKAAREAAEKAAQEIEQLLGRARGEIKRNPILAESMIADAQRLAEKIYYEMVLAKHGRRSE